MTGKEKYLKWQKENHIAFIDAKQTGNLHKVYEKFNYFPIVTKSKEVFINEANLVHNNQYDYSLFDYANSNTKGMIICPEHGKFDQTPSSHLSGSGCQKCGGNYRPKQKEIIKRFIKKHGVSKFNYKNFEYFGMKKEGEIICNKKHTFYITPYNHLKGGGCPICCRKQHNFLNYELAKEKIKPYNFNLIKEYQKYVRDNNILYLPINAEQYYKNTKEWISGGDFLGNGKIANQNMVFVNIDKFIDFINQLKKEGIKFNGSRDWVCYIKGKKLPNYIPRDPQTYYKKTGEWKSWSNSLNYQVKIIKRPFEFYINLINKNKEIKITKRTKIGDINIGAWLQTKKANYHDGKLTPDQIKQLESIKGWKW